MKLSIITPTLADMHYLKRLEASITLQVFPCSYEWIIINDNPQVVLKETDFSIPVVLFNNPENIGAADSREKGLSLAQGEYVYFMDDDDLWSGVSVFNWFGKQDFKTLMFCDYLFCKDKIEITSNFTTYSSLHAVFFNRQFLIDKDIHFLHKTLNEDTFFLRLANASALDRNHQERVVEAHIKRDGSLSKKNGAFYTYDTYLDMLDLLIKTLYDRHLDKHPLGVDVWIQNMRVVVDLETASDIRLTKDEKETLYRKIEQIEQKYKDYNKLV